MAISSASSTYSQGANKQMDPLPDRFALFYTISPAIFKILIVTVYSQLKKPTYY